MATGKISWRSVMRGFIFFWRAVFMIGGGLSLECATSCIVYFISKWTSSLLSNILYILISMAIVGVVLIIYTFFASKMRPYRHLDNDLPFTGSFLAAVIASFADNYTFNLLSSRFDQENGYMILIFFVLAFIFMGANLLIDSLYEKYDKDKIPFILIEAYTDKIEKSSITDDFFQEEVFHASIKKTKIVSIAIVFLTLAITVLSIILICIGVV